MGRDFWGNNDQKCGRHSLHHDYFMEKNLFLLPRGTKARNFIDELTRLLDLFVHKTPWENLALPMTHIFIPLMLQKPSARSNARDHVSYLGTRLDQWKAGDLEGLLKEGREIQKRLIRKKEGQRKNRMQRFTALMLVGNLSSAIKLLNAEDNIGGIHEPTPEVMDALLKKHPDAEPAKPEALINREPQEKIDPVIFEVIDGTVIYKAAKTTFGAVGPSHIDADGWRHILCSNAYNKSPESLCTAIAGVTKLLCREEVNPETLDQLLASRLVPLDKDPGSSVPAIRPIGIGEVLRRIMGKAVTQHLSGDIQHACGTLQTSTGIEAGVEATVHAMKKIFDDEGSDIVMLVDADNAFNRLNREAALANIEHTCTPFARYIRNTYHRPSKLFLDGGNYILSREGTTQGDNCASAVYSLSIKPLIDELKSVGEASQAWFADDAAAGGKMTDVKEWGNLLYRIGPSYGYFPKPSKTVVIVKRPEDLAEAEALFKPLGIKVTNDGERHLGAMVGTQQFRDEYVKRKVSHWVKDVEDLAEIAVEEPQVAYCGFVKALAHRWTFVQRTIADTTHLFQPLEDAIREKLIPSLIGREVSDVERRLLALPVRFGGLAIQNPVNTADREYK